jgi:hypothetical protein
MIDKDKALSLEQTLRLALETLEYAGPSWIEARQPAITAIKAALEAKDEPVAWMDASRFEELRNGFTVMTTLTKKKAFFDDIAIYTTPPQRKPLTDEQLKPHIQIAMKYYGYDETKYGLTTTSGFIWLARAIEAAHGIIDPTDLKGNHDA